MSRESNRARFPEFAAIVDACGGHAKLVFAEDAHGSLGKRPVPDACEVDGGRYADAARDFGHRPVKATT